MLTDMTAALKRSTRSNQSTCSSRRQIEYCTDSTEFVTQQPSCPAVAVLLPSLLTLKFAILKAHPDRSLQCFDMSLLMQALLAVALLQR